MSQKTELNLLYWGFVDNLKVVIVLYKGGVKMQAVILAAGKGSRMGSLTISTPKPLIKILNKPLIDYVFEALPDEVDECVMVVGYLGYQILSYVGSIYKGRRIYNVEQKYIGTAGGLLSAQHLLQDKFLVVNADDIYDKQELQLLIGEDATYGIALRNKTDKNTETVIFDDNSLLVSRNNVALDELRWFGTGSYMLHKYIWLENFYQLPNGEYSIPHTLINAGFPVYVKKFFKWLPVNTPRDIFITERELLKRF